jgi:hypothetical protein
MSGVRFYLRGRITRHIGWVLPIGGTRPMSWQSRQPRPARPVSRRLRRVAWLLLAAAAIMWALIAVFAH